MYFCNPEPNVTGTCGAGHNADWESSTTLGNSTLFQMRDFLEGALCWEATFRSPFMAKARKLI